ncbi:MAG: glucose-1-phosphate adenylyltransferase, partial [bacterium]|nr:glucose-1-phosphate adenylyltransferase [bacterium]
RGFGILKVNKNRKITHFEEKPKEDAVLDRMKMPRALMEETVEHPFLASMGIYIFNKDVLVDILEENMNEDFGKQIIPASIKTHRVYSYFFNGYWEDIGTIKSFFEANLDFANPKPRFNFYDEHYPIYTNARFLPGSKIKNCEIKRTLICDGSILEGSKISHSTIGLRAMVREGSKLDHVVMMGSDYYGVFKKRKGKNVGIGKNCIIKNAILDKNVHIGDNVVIDYKGKEQNKETEFYHVIDGIVVVPKNGYIPANTRIE